MQMFLLCFGPLGPQLTRRGSLVLLVSSYQLSINKSHSKEAFLLGVLVHASKVSKSLFNYALVLFNSSMFYFKFFIRF